VPIPLAELPQQSDEWQKLVDEMAAEGRRGHEYIRNLEQRDGTRSTEAQWAQRRAMPSPASSSATCVAATAVAASAGRPRPTAVADQLAGLDRIGRGQVHASQPADV